MTKLLEETLCREDASEIYSVNLYNKVNSSEMFGYACSSGFGSSRGGKGCSSGFGSSRGGVSSSFGSPIGSQGSGFEKGSIGNIRHDLNLGLQERFDFSGHDKTVHVNYDLKGSKKGYSGKALKEEHKVTLWDKFLDIIY